MNITIPLRAKDDEDYPTLKKIDKDIIVYAVLHNAPNDKAYLMHYPELADATGRGLNSTGKSENRMFWSYGKVREYRQSYENTLDEHFGKQKTQKGNRCKNTEYGKERTDRAVKKLVGDILQSIENNDNLDPDTLKDFVDIAKKLNIIEDKEVEVEKPRRYLPVRCSECMYKSFVESHIKTGDIENSCLRCKALKIAESNGYILHPETNLNTSEIK